MKHHFIAAILLAIAVLPGCKKHGPANSSPTPTPAPAGPTITASPNPVPAGDGPGETTIAWDTGGDGAIVDVYLSVDGKEETLFATHSKSEKKVDWIAAGPVYEFRMYATGEHKDVLGSVKVTRKRK